ncbi:MAG: PqqD family protein [Anaerolineae bacterium]
MVSRKIAGEFILVPIRNDVGDLESIYMLNETGARIWELIDGRRTVAEIRDIITQEYAVPHDRVETELTTFLEQLHQIGGIVAA